MPNDILITPGSASIAFSGSAINTIRLQVEPSGSVAFYGNSGSLFSITDQLSGSLMSVNDISGLPILEVFSDDRVVMGTYNTNTLVVTGSRVGVGTAIPTNKLQIDGNVSASSYTSSINNAVGFFGTSSWAVTASFAVTPSGTSGTSGSSGTSGTAGSSGTSGITGSSGTSGTSGSSGTLTLSGATDNGVITLNGSAPNATVESGLTYNGSTLTVRGDTSANNFVQSWGLGGGSGGYTTLDLIKTADTAGDFIIRSYAAGGATAPKIALGGFNATPFNGAQLTLDTSAGNVGIGTTSPAAKLEVLGGSASNLKAGVWTSNSGFTALSLNGDMATGANFYSSPTQPLIINRQTGYDISFRENNSEQMVIKTSTGNVGIGTTSPGFKLDVIGRMLLRSDGAASAGHWLTDNTGTTDVFTGLVGVSSTDSWGVYSQGSWRLIVSNGGNVGINTTSPLANLSILSSIYDAPGATNKGAFQIGFANTNGISFGSYNASPFANYIQSIDYRSGQSNTYPLVLNPIGGNVGIGTTSPVAAFDVRGNIFVDNTNGTLTIRGGDATNQQQIRVRMLGTDGVLDVTRNSGTAPNLIFGTEGTERMRLDANGNLGLGVTPSAWIAGSRAAQLSTVTAVYQDFNGGANFGQNAYESADGVFRYLVNFYATRYHQQSGQHRWYTAASGTAGNTISFTQAMTLDASGNLGIGVSPSTKLHVSGGTTRIQATSDGNDGILRVTDTAVSTQVQTYATSTTGYMGVVESKPLVLLTNNTERARIDSSGNLGVGTTNPTQKLHVEGNIYLPPNTGNTGSLLAINNDNFTYDGVTIPHYGLKWATLSSNAGVSSLISGYYGIMLFAGGLERVRINSSGNVGIGTTDPQARLAITQVGTAAQAIHLYNNNGTNLRYSEIKSQWTSTDGSHTAAIRFLKDVAVEGHYGSSIGFVTELTQASQDINYAMYIKNRNVGIGTTSPNAKLHIVQSNAEGVYLDGALDYSTYKFLYGGTQKAEMVWYNAGNAFYLQNFVSNGTFTYYRAGNADFVINGTGNVGIGTTSPAAKLDVRGDVYTTSTWWGYPTELVGRVTRGGSGLADLQIVQAGGAFRVINSAYNNALFVVNDIGTFYSSGSATIANSVGTGDAYLDIGQGRNANGYAYVDLVGDTTYTDYGLRLIRNNGGANASSFLSHRGTGELGIFTQEAAPITFYTSGTEKVRITSNGDVGIGTTSPQKPLEVISSANDFVSVGVVQMSVGQWAGIHFGYREANTFYRKSAIVFERTDLTASDAQGKIHILNGPQGSNGSATLSDAKLTIAENGNVGIGTTSPSTKLHLYEAGAADAIFRITPANVSYDSLIQLVGQGNNITTEGFEIWYDNDVGDVHLGTTYADDAASIHFHTRTGASKSTSNERLTILGGGNVGINTTSPSAKLHVVGSAILANATSIDPDSYTGTVIAGTIADGSGWSATGIGGNGGGTGDSWGIAHNGSALYFGMQDNASVNTMQTYMRFDPNRNVYLVETSGNVGIGTTSPISKLTVTKAGVSVPTTVDSTNNAHLTLAGSDSLVRLQLGTQNVSPYGGWIQASYDNTGGNNGVEPLLLNPIGGNVGIGTTNPTARLQISGSANSYMIDAQSNGFDGSAVLMPGLFFIGTLSSGYPEIGYNFNAFNGVYTKIANDTAWKITFGVGNRMDFANAGTGTGTFSWTTRMSILSASGNVGIGTTSPNRKLQVGTVSVDANADANADILSEGGVTIKGGSWLSLDNSYTVHGRMRFDTSAFGAEIAMKLDSYYGFDFQTRGGGSRMVILGNNGNVGIGTTSPSYKLDVIGTSRAQTLYAQGVSGDSGNIIIQSGSSNAFWISGKANAGGAGTLHIGANGPTEPTAGVIVINTSNNVGIGTTNFSAKLQVSGSVVATAYNEPTTLGAVLAADGTNALLYARNGSTSWAPMYIDATTLYLNAQSSGNVGIGTTSPTEKLDVSGAIAVSGLRSLVVPSGNTINGNINAVWGLLKVAGKKLYYDEDFSDGSNSIGVYNNLGGSAVTHTRKNSSFVESGVSPVPNKSGYVIEIRHAATESSGISPGNGGWFFATDTSPGSRRLLVIFKMKIPSGRNVVYASNSIGTSGTQTWLTSTAGTGYYQDYACIVHSGTASFSSTHFYYIDGDSSTFYTYLASATVYDITDVSADTVRSLAVGTNSTPPTQGALIVGNVGIGTTSPNSKLDVRGILRVGSGAAVNDAGATNYISVSTATIGQSTGIEFFTNDGTYNPRAWIVHTNSANSQLLTFNSTYSSGTGYANFSFLNGNVGIGTTNPTAKLHVASNAGMYYTNTDFVASSVGSGVIIGTGATSGNTYGTIYGFQAGNTSYANLVIPGGNVGIGTTNPGTKLTVNGATTITGSSTIIGNLVVGQNSNSSTAARIDLTAGGNGFDSLIDFGYHDTFDASIWNIGRKGSTGAFFISNYSTGPEVNVVTINTSNNVGIGTTDPGAYKLDVAGITRISGNYLSINDVGYLRGDSAGVLVIQGGSTSTVFNNSSNSATLVTILNGGNVGIGTTSPQTTLHVLGTVGYGTIRISPTSNNGESAIAFFTDAAGTDTNDAWVVGHAGWGNTGDFVIGNENNGAGGNVRLLIEKAGNVGIGTTSPDAKLHVVGGLLVSQSAAVVEKVAHSAGADDYHLEVYAREGATLGETSIRFHQSNRYYHQIRTRGSGFRFTQGNSDSLVDIYANTVYGLSSVGFVGTSSWAVSASWAPGSSGVTINNNTDNYVVTATGTANTLNGEANLTFDGTTLNVTGSGAKILTGNGTAAAPSISFTSDTNLGIFRQSADNISITTAGVERIRVRDNGYCSIDTTNSISTLAGEVHTIKGNPGSQVLTVDNANTSTPNGIQISFSGAAPDNNSQTFLQCVDTVANRCYIWADGDLANHDGTYGTISDVNLKQDIIDANSQWEDIKLIRFRKYRMKTDVEANPNAPYMLGVIAQELEQTSPLLVDEHPDIRQQEVIDENGNITTEQVQVGTIKTVKSSILLTKAAVALQEAIARIELLEARIATLESQQPQ